MLANHQYGNCLQAIQVRPIFHKILLIHNGGITGNNFIPQSSKTRGDDGRAIENPFIYRTGGL